MFEHLAESCFWRSEEPSVTLGWFASILEVAPDAVCMGDVDQRVLQRDTVLVDVT